MKENHGNRGNPKLDAYGCPTGGPKAYKQSKRLICHILADSRRRKAEFKAQQLANMPTSKPQVITVPVSVDKSSSSGFHIFELHAPSVGVGLSGLIVVALVVFVAIYIWRKGVCQLFCKKRERDLERGSLRFRQYPTNPYLMDPIPTAAPYPYPALPEAGRYQRPALRYYDDLALQPFEARPRPVEPPVRQLDDQVVLRQQQPVMAAPQPMLGAPPQPMPGAPPQQAAAPPQPLPRAGPAQPAA